MCTVGVPIERAKLALLVHLPGVDAAKAAKAPTPLGAGAAAIYERYVEAGEGARDFSGIIRYLRGE